VATASGRNLAKPEIKQKPKGNALSVFPLLDRATSRGRKAAHGCLWVPSGREVARSRALLRLAPPGAIREADFQNSMDVGFKQHNKAYWIWHWHSPMWVTVEVF